MLSKNVLEAAVGTGETTVWHWNGIGSTPDTWQGTVGREIKAAILRFT